MPELPSFLAERAERWFGDPITVAAVNDLGPRFRRVVLLGEALRGRAWSPGQEVAFRVSPCCFRHYTPATFDPVDGIMSILFFRHGAGPGTAWADSLKPSTDVRVMGPGGGLLPEAVPESRVFIGDETTVGLLRALSSSPSWDPRRCSAAIECERADEPFLSWFVPGVVPLPREGVERGMAGATWLRHHIDRKTAALYLAGHTQSIQRWRSIADERGVARSALRTKPYWADGKRGL